MMVFEIILLDGNLTAVKVNRVAHGLERKEADADGQRDLFEPDHDARDGIYRLQKEACVFEKCEAGKVYYNRKNQADFSLRGT